MKESENSKQLKMALTEHKNLTLDTGDNIKFLLTWEDKCSNYRGHSLPEKFDMGTFDLELLLKIIDGEIKHASLEFYEGEQK